MNYLKSVFLNIIPFPAMPKIQHRADSSNSGIDYSQYISNEKLQQYLKEQPWNSYFPSSQSGSNEAAAVQSDTMENDGQSQTQSQSQSQFQQYMKNCMQAPSSGAAASGTKAEGNSNPWDQYVSQFSNQQQTQSFSQYYDPNRYKACTQQWQSYGSNFPNANNWQNIPQGFNLPSTSNSQTAQSSS